MLKTRFMLTICLLFTGLISTAFSAETESVEATTTANPEVPVDELVLLLRPLNRAQLEAEANAWLGLLSGKTAEISEAEIGAKYKRTELQYADDLQAAIDRIEHAQITVNEQPNNAQAAAELETAIETGKALKQETSAAIANIESNAAVNESIDKAIIFSQQQATNEQAGEGKESVNEAPEPNSEPSTKLDKQNRKLEMARQLVSLAAEERSLIREQLLTYVNHLRTEQIGLTDRCNIVIGEWEQKGGDVTEARQFIAAISGLQIDITDAEATWETISGWVISEEGGIRWLKNISVFVLTLVVFYILSKLAARATRKIFSRTANTSQLLEDFMIVTVRRMVFAIGFLVALTTLEVNVGPLLAVIGAAGFVIAFALQDSLGNFASGILILLFKPFDVGDLVEIGGILGRVKSVNLLSVQISTPDNQMVIVPNNSVWSSSITNVTGSTTRRVDLIFGISYDDDIDKAQHIMDDIVAHQELVLKEPKPVIEVHELADSSVNFVCRPWVRTEDYWTVYWGITRAVKLRFDAEGISIPYPQQDIHHYNVAATPAVAAALPDAQTDPSTRKVTTDQRAADTDQDDG